MYKFAGTCSAFAAFIFLVVALGLYFGGYNVSKESNERAQNATCEQATDIVKQFCTDPKSGVVSECFKGLLYNRVLGSSCGIVGYAGIFNTQVAAQNYLSKYDTYTYSCFVDPQDTCRPFRYMKATNGFLISSMVCFAMAGAFVLASVVLFLFQFCGRGAESGTAMK